MAVLFQEVEHTQEGEALVALNEVLSFHDGMGEYSGLERQVGAFIIGILP